MHSFTIFTFTINSFTINYLFFRIVLYSPGRVLPFTREKPLPCGFVRNALFSSGIRELSHQDQRSGVEGHRDKATASLLISMCDRGASVKNTWKPGTSTQIMEKNIPVYWKKKKNRSLLQAPSSCLWRRQGESERAEADERAAALPADNGRKQSGWEPEHSSPHGLEGPLELPHPQTVSRGEQQPRQHHTQGKWLQRGQRC